jgi:hypothetical protein
VVGLTLMLSWLTNWYAEAAKKDLFFATISSMQEKKRERKTRQKEREQKRKFHVKKIS